MLGGSAEGRDKFVRHLRRVARVRNRTWYSDGRHRLKVAFAVGSAWLHVVWSPSEEIRAVGASSVSRPLRSFMSPHTGSARPPPVGDLSAPADSVASASVTALLVDLAHGDSDAGKALFTLLYDELRRIARRQLRSEPTGHTLSATALVHEAYLQLVDQTRAQWLNRAQFLAVAARAMRRILVDHARRVRAGKRGGGWQRLDLCDAEIATAPRAEMLVALDEALDELNELNPRLTQVVECRFFGGMTEEETALALSITDRTVRRDWVKAKGWLSGKLGSIPGS